MRAIDKMKSDDSVSDSLCGSEIESVEVEEGCGLHRFLDSANIKFFHELVNIVNEHFNSGEASKYALNSGETPLFFQELICGRLYEDDIRPLLKRINYNNLVDVTKAEIDHDNNSVNLAYITDGLIEYNSINYRCYKYSLIERLICFGEVEGWEEYYVLGMHYYNLLSDDEKDIVNSNINEVSMDL
jgi:hypothetical protein